MTKQKIIANPSEWIVTYQGDFVRIKDSEKYVEKKLEVIREHLKNPYKGVVRFHGKTPEQIGKERYDKVLEEVNFDYEKLHDWIYDEKNKDRVEIIKLEGKEFQEAVLTIFSYVESSQNKWREKIFKEPNKKRSVSLVNEETGQVIYPFFFSNPNFSEFCQNFWNSCYRDGREEILIPQPRRIHGPSQKHTSTIIFLHGTYGAINNFREIEKNFPNTKFIYPYSPVIQYDMWHGTQPAPGRQCQGWINITGDANEIMDIDVCPDNSPPKKNFEEADKIIHLDYPQLMRAVSYINEIIEEEIETGITLDKIFIAGYSQGGLLTLATALSSQHKLGGFISLCGLLPRWDKSLVKPSEKNKETPCLIINNSGDPWVPFWTGQKTYNILKEKGYNVEFITNPGLGHAWKSKNVINFLGKCLGEDVKNQSSQVDKKSHVFQITITLLLVSGVVIGIIMILKIKKKKK